MLSILNELIQALEGPYRWYAIGAIVILVGFMLAKTMFKTLKWMLIIAFFVILGLVVAKFSDVIQY